MLGRQLALIRRADLNIVDAVWVNPASQGQYADEAVRDNILLASTDPFAVDYYTSAYVLVPHLTPGSGRAHKADARYHGGEFRRLLMTNENRTRLKGMTDIIDLDDSLTVDEEQAQFNVFIADASAPPGVTLSLTAEPVSRTVLPGDTTTYTLSVTASEGFTSPVILTLQGAPSETIFSFAPNPVTPPSDSQLCITTTASTAVGTYAMTVTGTADQVTDTTSLTLTINSLLTLIAQPDVQTVLPGDTTAYTLSVTASEGFTSPVILTLQGAPSETAFSFVPNPVTPPGDSQLCITTTASTEAGTYAMTVTGTSGVLTDTASVILMVASAAPDFVNYLPIILKMNTMSVQW